MGNITSQQVIDTAKRMLKLTQTSEFDSEFSIWVQVGFRKLYNLNTYLPFDVYLPVVNNRVKKPQGYHSFIGMALNSNTPIIYMNDKYKSTATATTEINVTYYNYFNTCQESVNYIELGSLCDDATEAHLWFLGTPIDTDCNLLIDEEAEEALKYFLAWKFSESMNGIDLEKKTQYYGTMFDRESGILRGHIAKRDADQRRYELNSTANGLMVFYQY